MPVARRGPSSSLAVLAAGLVLALAVEAHADDKQQCVAASEKAQQLRNAGKLSQAREQLATCGRASVRS